MLLVIGFSFAIGLGCVAMNAALVRAQEGYEDNAGFHEMTETEFDENDLTISCSE